MPIKKLSSRPTKQHTDEPMEVTHWLARYSRAKPLLMSQTMYDTLAEDPLCEGLMDRAKVK